MLLVDHSFLSIVLFPFEYKNRVFVVGGSASCGGRGDSVRRMSGAHRRRRRRRPAAGRLGTSRDVEMGISATSISGRSTTTICLARLI